MLVHRSVPGLLPLCLITLMIGCSNPQGLDFIRISPATQALAVGQTTQFTAVGTYGNAKHPTTQNVTSGVTWVSSAPAVATVNTSGMVTAVGAGTTTITANATAFNGPVSSSATITVTGTPGTLLSLTIIPGSIGVASLQETGQFLAIGTFSTAPTIRDLTNSTSLQWISSAPNVIAINSNDPNHNSGILGATAGVATPNAAGTATITAEATGSDGSIQTAIATFSCAPCSTPSPGILGTLTVYKEGLNTTNWLVTAPSATGTPNVLRCGPGAANIGGSVCTATYPIGTTVTLTESGGNFGGWSTTCNQISATQCTVVIGSTSVNASVGAIFN